MKKKHYLLFNGIILLLLLSWSVYRDIIYLKMFPGDLRNRVVGARLIDDGILPYFYQWKEGDNTRYIDYANIGEVKHSNITGSPFLHQLMIPLSRLPQKTICDIWLLLQYACLFTIIYTAVRLSTTNIQQLLIINSGVLFTYTHAWKHHVFVGQMYMLVAAMAALIAFLLIKYKRRSLDILAGLILTLLILIRPVFIVFLVPFLYFFQHRKNFVLATAAGGFLALFVILISPWQRAIWSDYRQGMESHITMHQGPPLVYAPADTLPYIKSFENYDMDEVATLSKTSFYINYSENGNVFVLYKLMTGKQMPVQQLYFMCLVVIALLYAFYHIQSVRRGFAITHAVLIGLVLYMIVEIFLPIHRHQYNTVQFFTLISLFFSMNNRYKYLPFFLVVAGILLNITNTMLLPLRHTIGELLILSAILLHVYLPGVERKQTTANRISSNV